MLRHRPRICNQSFNKPGVLLHECTKSEFLTLKFVRAASSGDNTPCAELNAEDMVRISVGEEVFMFVSCEAITKTGSVIENFPIHHGDAVRVAVSNRLLNQCLFFGWTE